MALHRLSSVTIGVPNVTETAAYYREFGLTPDSGGWFRTRDAGRQLRLVHSPARRLVELSVGADDADDIARIAAALTSLDFGTSVNPSSVTAVEPATGVKVVVEVAERVSQRPVLGTVYNGPGRYDRTGARAPGIQRDDPVMPRKLGHTVVGSPDFEVSHRFFTRGLGFKVSDHIKDNGVFLRCSTDHHNVLILAAPLSFLHHTAWQVDDIDDVGRGAFAMLEDHPDRHVWGLGRHHAGSNFFWYLKDPAGNFTEYYADMDCIVDDKLWTPEVLQGARGLFSWGPRPPASFLHPEDLAALMTGAHNPG